MEILIASGFTVDWEVSGEEAVAKVEKEAFQLVLMDIELPGIDGVEATKLIKSLHKPALVIALTSHAMKGEQGWGLQSQSNLWNFLEAG